MFFALRSSVLRSIGRALLGLVCLGGGPLVPRPEVVM